MVELRGLRTKAGFNIAQALAPDQLRECEAQILIEARKPLDPALAVVARHATTKRCQRQVLHKLGKDIMALMHGDTLAAVGPHRCAAFPFTIEIETAPKSLFFPKFQHVSVRPTSNVGTAVILTYHLDGAEYRGSTSEFLSIECHTGKYRQLKEPVESDVRLGTAYWEEQPAGRPQLRG